MPRKTKPLTWDDVRRIMRAFPGTQEATSYGTPSFKVAKKFLTRLKEDGVSVVMPVSMDEREVLTEADPKTFFVTDHYRSYPLMLVNLETVSEAQLVRLYEQAWRAVVPKKFLDAYAAPASRKR